MRYPVTATGSRVDFERDWYSAQGFGNPTVYGFHEGQDWNLRTGGDTDLGQEIKAIANGTIVYYHFSSHPSSNFGRHHVYRIDGPWGSRWVHECHLSDQDFKTSGTVTEGQIIGRVGKSGTPYAHLHFAIFKIDPATIIANTSSGKPIDNIAKTQQQLNDWWEDPTTFINTWMNVSPTPTPQPITDQTIIPANLLNWSQDLEVQQIRGILNDQKNKITSLENKINNAKVALN